MISPLIKKALYFAAEKHDGQYRKGVRVPYIVHPVQVAFGVGEYTGNEQIIAAALLHDVLEDCADVTLPLLQKEFGDHVAQLVSEVSLVENEKYKTWKEKKDAYLEKIKRASGDALLIVALDKMTNFPAYFDALQAKNMKTVAEFGGTPCDYVWYYTEIGIILISMLPAHPVTKDYIALWGQYKHENL